MHLSSFLVSILTAGAFALPRNNNDNNNHRQEHHICPNLRTADNGCIRFTRGFDVTGVTTDIELTFPRIKNKCDCIQACLNRLGTCANYVWKFSTPESVHSGHRTCTLYSNFNLPPGVTLAFDAAHSTNIQPLEPDNNPQKGGLVPQAFRDANLSTTADPDAVSGPVWALANGQVQC